MSLNTCTKYSAYGLYGPDYNMAVARVMVPPPLGYRWLDVGERVMTGDWICDLRAEPYKIVVTENYSRTLAYYDHLAARKLDESAPDDITVQEALFYEYV